RNVTGVQTCALPILMQFATTADPLRYSPAVHVNQEGYVPSLPKKAMVGYSLGNLGEMDIAPSLGFKLVDTTSGAVVYQGSLNNRSEERRVGKVVRSQ